MPGPNRRHRLLRDLRPVLAVPAFHQLREALMSVHVTHHAIDRYIERIAPVDRVAARAMIMSAERAIEFAAAFGAHTVRIGNGAKLAITGRDHIGVVTVLPRDWFNSADLPRSWRRDPLQ